MKRTHDRFYLNEDNKKVKQSFVEVADEISKYNFQTIADIGCATGAFPNYLKNRFQHAEVIGIEYLDSLLTKARKDFPHLNFIKGDVLDTNSVPKKFDVITMLGVLGIFDNYKTVLDNVIQWLNPHGILVMQNLVSDYDIDVFIKYKPSSVDYEEDELESGWNIISYKSLEAAAKANNSQLVFSKDFYLATKLEKKKDVMRSWTELNPLGKNDIFNALHIRQPQKIVVIQKQ